MAKIMSAGKQGRESNVALRIAWVFSFFTGYATIQPKGAPMPRLIYAILTLTVMASTATGVVRAKPRVPLPFDTSNTSIRSLYEHVDRDLEQRLMAAINQNKTWRRLCLKKKMAVGIVDIGDPDNVRFARINGSTMMYAASLPKVAVLLAVVQSLEDGALAETAKVRTDMRLMIRRSDNAATTRLIDRVGFEKIEKVLTDPRYRLYNPKRGGGLWVGKRYAATGERHPDPLQGLSHAASVTQVCRFYYLMAMGRLINPRRSRQMLDIMSEPALHHKFVGVLENRVPEAVLFRKSGSWKIWHSDSVLVWGPQWRRYIAVAIVENQNGEKIMRNLIGVLDDMMIKDHGDRRKTPKNVNRPPVKTKP